MYALFIYTNYPDTNQPDIRHDSNVRIYYPRYPRGLARRFKENLKRPIAVRFVDKDDFYTYDEAKCLAPPKGDKTSEYYKWLILCKNAVRLLQPITINTSNTFMTSEFYQQFPILSEPESTIPSGHRKLGPGEITQEGDLYLPLNGQLRPVISNLGIFVSDITDVAPTTHIIRPMNSTKAKTDKVNTGLTLIPFHSLFALGKIFVEGLRYGKDNWKKGVGDKEYQEERLEHALTHLSLWKEGDRSEAHLAKVAWFCFTQLELERLENASNP